MSKINKKDNAQSNIKKRRRIYIIAVAAVAVILACILTVGTAFSWFSPPVVSGSDSTVKATDFSAQTLISTNGTDYNVLNAESKNDISVADVSDVTMKIRYVGDSSAYLKVQLFDSWFKDSVVVPTGDLTYTVDPEYWQYNESDGCFYSINPISAYIESDKTASTFDIPFVTKIESSGYTDSDVYFNLVSVVESVQPDRYDEFFGTNTTAATEETTE